MENKNPTPSNALIYLLPPFRSILFIVFGYISFWIFKGQNAGLAETARWWPLSFIVVNLLTIGLLALLLKKEGKTFLDIINKERKPNGDLKDTLWIVPLMLVLGIGGLLGFSLLVTGHLPASTLQPVPLWAAVTALVLLPATVIVAEIPFYLGYCAPRLEQQCGNRVFSIVYPLFFFALQHSFIPLLWDVRHLFVRFLIFIPLLIFIGIRYSKNRDLRQMMIGHGVLDFFTGVQLLMVSIDPAIYDMMINT